MNGFWLHAIPSTIAAMLMIWLAWQSKQGRMKGHKRIAQAMLIFALIGLVGAVIYWITWTGFNIYFVHNALGFAGLHYWVVFRQTSMAKNRAASSGSARDVRLFSDRWAKAAASLQ